jgi:hypothetical protein
MTIRIGRRTKLTPEIQSKLVQAISLGTSYEAAATYAGVSRETVRSWLRRGERETRGIYHEFAEAMKVADGKATVACLATIRSAAQNDWKAAAWLLERRHPNEFGRARLEITGPNGGPLQSEVRAETKHVFDAGKKARILAILKECGALDPPPSPSGEEAPKDDARGEEGTNGARAG